MSFPRDLDEFGEDELVDELRRRFEARREGKCDYCGRPHDARPPCKFSGRHGAPPSDPTPGNLRLDLTDPRDRLTRWLVQHPLELDYVVRRMELSLPTCEGHGGPCTGPVLWQTPAMTRYVWDGTGEDPNRAQSLCVRCSSSYRSDWAERWREYYGSVL